jgi:hypothetical protein
MVKVTGFPEAVAAFEIVALMALATAVMVVLAGIPGPVIERPTSPAGVVTVLPMPVNCAPAGDVIVVLALTVWPSEKLRPSETWGLPPVPGAGPYALCAYVRLVPPGVGIGPNENALCRCASLGRMPKINVAGLAPALAPDEMVALVPLATAVMVVPELKTKVPVAS